MRNIWTIAKREYDHYFISPIAYAVAFAILLGVGFVFAFSFLQFSQNAMQSFGQVPDLSPVTGTFLFLIVIATPAITMRLISDEARMGTLELLLTAPVRDFELVLGKWLGALLFMLTLLATTLVYPIILNNFVTPGIDLRIVATTYLGLILISGVFLAIGTGISALFTNQIASFFVTFIVFIFLWWLVGFPAYVIAGDSAEIFRYLDMRTHFNGALSNGIVNLSDIVYYLSLIALGLFTATAAVETRRWR